MVEPLMLLLSSINAQFEYDHPVDIMYLGREDRNTIMVEANRLGRLASDDERILTRTDLTGKIVADTAQVAGGSVIEVHPATAAMLTRIREAYQVYTKYLTSTTSVEQEDEDLGADTVVLRLEGNPRYIYVYVYNLMETRGIDYKTKLGKLYELYTTLIACTNAQVDNSRVKFLQSRFELQSTLQFWQTMLTGDIMRQYGSVATLTEKDIETVKSELKQLGFYGFVNPLQMYTDFSSARINRKVEVNIAPEVIDFLEKVVISSGIEF